MQAKYDNTTIGLDSGKNVFYLSEMNCNMKLIRQAKLKRNQVLGYFSALDAATIRCVAMESCGGAYYLGRKF